MRYRTPRGGDEQQSCNEANFVAFNDMLWRYTIQTVMCQDATYFDIRKADQVCSAASGVCCDNICPARLAHAIAGCYIVGTSGLF